VCVPCASLLHAPHSCCCLPVPARAPASACLSAEAVLAQCPTEATAAALQYTHTCAYTRIHMCTRARAHRVRTLHAQSHHTRINHAHLPCMQRQRSTDLSPGSSCPSPGTDVPQTQTARQLQAGCSNSMPASSGCSSPKVRGRAHTHNTCWSLCQHTPG